MGNNARKRLQRSTIIHTDHLKGHDPSDVIVIYSKYEDLITKSQDQPGQHYIFHNGFVPTWSMKPLGFGCR